MDFELAAKLSGARFVVLKAGLARMERALANFMLDLHTVEFGYTEVIPPALVKDDTVYGTGQLPKFSEDLFHTDDGYWLIPTAEVPLTSLVAKGYLASRRSATALHRLDALLSVRSGRCREGYAWNIRQHQFSKVELVV